MEGSNLTPAHHYSDFRFKTYAPVAFRYFRELFGIQPDDFLLSLCNESLRELSNPGASGSIFYITNDDEFIIKTVQHKEAEFLQKLLPGYYMNLNQNPRTLLPKFYGLYCYQCGGKNIRFVVMNNLLPSSIKMHEKYDLKGSTYKRKASKHERAKKSPTLKDLDFRELHPDAIMLEADTYTALQKTLERDCRVLQSFKIMDFSFLVGVYNLDQAAKEQLENSGGASAEEPSSGPGSGGSTNDANSAMQRSFSRGRSMKQRIANYSTAMEAIQARSEPVELENEDVPAGGIPARNGKGERLLLYLGIIDILQSYRLKKKIEHAMKAMVHDADTISVHRPGFYAQRFQTFLGEAVFKKIPSLDQPQYKGPHMRFRKLVHLALKHSPSKRKSGALRQKSVNESEGRTERIRTISGTEETVGATGGRPDLLPATSTPPPTFAEAAADRRSPLASTYVPTSVSTRISMTSNTYSPDTKDIPSGPTFHVSQVDMDPAHGGSRGVMGSPVHSISESTPTHTEYTEGTPSFTTSSPSCSSDVLDSASQPSVRGYLSRSSHVSTEQIEIEMTNGPASNVTVVSGLSGSHGENQASGAHGHEGDDKNVPQDTSAPASQEVVVHDEMTRL